MADFFSLRIFHAALLIGCMTLPGCRRHAVSEKSPPHSGGTTTATKLIGISYLTGENPFFTAIAECAGSRLEARGFQVAMADATNDPEKQDRQMNAFIESKAAAIIVIPCHSLSIGQAIRKANQASIPVFTCDVAAIDPKAKVVCHIATDNYGGGKLAGHQILEAIGNRGDIAVIDYQGIESVQQRIRGFREVIAYANKEGADVRIVDTVSAAGDRQKAGTVMRQLLKEHPDLSAVFAVNDPTVFGAIDALSEMKKLGSVKLVGFDGTREAKRFVREGVIHSDIVQFPEEIAKYCTESVQSHLNGNTIPSIILIPTSAYNRDEAANDSGLDQ